MDAAPRNSRERTAEPVSRDQILRCEREQGKKHIPYSADHKQDWQPYPVDPTLIALCDDHIIYIKIRYGCQKSTNPALTRIELTTSALFFLLFVNLTYSRWTSSLPSCLWSL